MQSTFLPWFPEDLPPMSPLVRAHAVACAFHTILLISFIVGLFVQDGVQTVRLYDNWPSWNSTLCEAQFGPSAVELCPVSDGWEFVTTINISVVLTVSQAITAAAHFLQAMWARDRQGVYTLLTWSGIKAAFWLEYALTASAMAFVVTYYSGVIEARSQLVIVAAQSTLMFLGLLLDLLRFVERALPHVTHAAQDISKILRAVCGVVFVFGFYNVVTIWAPSIARLASGSSSAPQWVVVVVLLEAALYTSFGLVQLATFWRFLTQGTPTSPTTLIWEHMALIVLSFVSKAVLNVLFSACLIYQVC